MSDTTTTTTTTDYPERTVGLLAEYATPEAILEAAERIRDAGYTKWDTYTPYPVHGMDDAMGVKMTVLPWIVLACGLFGCASGVLMQWWMNTIDYPFYVSGKPLFSLPANIPITFEFTILLSAFGAFLGMLGLNQLPQLWNPLFRSSLFRRATDNRFFVTVDSRDPQFNESQTTQLLHDTGAAVVEPVKKVERPVRIPPTLHYVGLIVTLFAVIPPAVIVAARASTKTEPPIHPIPNMDWQAKIKPQRPNALFVDDRGSRLPVPGTIARGELFDDEHFYRGVVGDQWANTFPEQISIDAKTMDRGRERFNIYCSACHGITGDGQGMVHLRAVERQEPAWRPPTALFDGPVRQQPVGQLFNTLTHGVRNMPAYGSQVPPEDRWAILLYVRALQRSHNAATDDVPEDERAALQ